MLFHAWTFWMRIANISWNDLYATKVLLPALAWQRMLNVECEKKTFSKGLLTRIKFNGHDSLTFYSRWKLLSRLMFHFTIFFNFIILESWKWRMCKYFSLRTLLQLYEEVRKTALILYRVNLKVEITLLNFQAKVCFLSFS